MGTLRMSEKMVIPHNSAFMTFSFSSFNRAISSRVMSRTSMSLKSSSGSFLRNIFNDGDDDLTNDDEGVVVVAGGWTRLVRDGVNADTASIHVMKINTGRKTVIIVGMIVQEDG